MAETKNMLLFRKWDLSNIEVKDPGLKTAISLRKQILPYTYGRSAPVSYTHLTLPTICSV